MFSRWTPRLRRFHFKNCGLLGFFLALNVILSIMLLELTWHSITHNSIDNNDTDLHLTIIHSSNSSDDSIENSIEHLNNECNDQANDIAWLNMDRYWNLTFVVHHHVPKTGGTALESRVMSLYDPSLPKPVGRMHKVSFTYTTVFQTHLHTVIDTIHIYI